VELHLVGGFLGSGKSTAIAAAAHLLARRGRRVGVITNDQGRQLVDTAFFRSGGIATTEVSGGCFCCNYDELAALIAGLAKNEKPDVVFAESVGSCADIVATVVKPLLRDAHISAQLASFSVFADCRLLSRYLSEESLPFSADILYIFAKQIEEAGLLVINKADLMSRDETDRLVQRAAHRYPDKRLRVQSSLDAEDVSGWLRWLETGQAGAPDRSLVIDYDRYGRGEAELAWMDCTIELYVPRESRDKSAPRRVIRDFFDRLVMEITERGYTIGHIKALVRGEHGEAKISLTTTGEVPPIPEIRGGRQTVLMNARVQAGAPQMRDLIAEVISRVADSSGSLWSIGTEDAFHPTYPRPRHRL
jgi:Ni2+-binding GTPase involved in maturation of urease and hydrogenase